MFKCLWKGIYGKVFDAVNIKKKKKKKGTIYVSGL